MNRTSKMTLACIGDQLSLLGYSLVRSRSFGRRRTLDCSERVNILDRTCDGKSLFSCLLGIRFDSVESLLKRDDGNPAFSTVICPIHLLKPDKHFFEYSGASAEELQVAANDLRRDITAFGDTFFNRFSSIELVEQELEGPSPSEYCTLAKIQRLQVLAAVAILGDSPSKADRLIEDALQSSGFRNPGMQLRVKELRLSLLGDRRS